LVCCSLYDADSPNDLHRREGSTRQLSLWLPSTLWADATLTSPPATSLRGPGNMKRASASEPASAARCGFPTSSGMMPEPGEWDQSVTLLILHFHEWSSALLGTALYMRRSCRYRASVQRVRTVLRASPSVQPRSVSFRPARENVPPIPCLPP